MDGVADLGELYPVDDGCVDFMRRYHPRWQAIYSGEPPWYTGEGEDRFRLGAAKVLCAYLAALNTAELEVRVDGADSPGHRLVAGALERSAFWSRLAGQAELCEAMGGVFLKPYNRGRQLLVDFVPADCFYPISWDGRRFLEGVFLTEHRRGDGVFTRLEAHTFAGEGRLCVENRLFRREARGRGLGREVVLDTLPELRGVAGRAEFSREIPLFSHAAPAVANHLAAGCPLGVARFAAAEDTLKAADRAFREWQLDRVASRKKILAPAEWFRRRITDDGQVWTAWDEETSVFQRMNYRATEEQSPVTFAPGYDVAGRLADLDGALNVLCLQTGLSGGAISFDGSAGHLRTATEVRSENSRTFQTVSQNQRVLGAAVKDVAESLLYLAAHPDFGLLAPGAHQVAVTFDDSVTPDRETYLAEGMALVERGLLSRWSFLTEYCGMTDRRAGEELARLEAEAGAAAGSVPPA